MFARVFNTAKRLISRSPSVQRESVEPSGTTSRSVGADLEVDMVTTRRGTVSSPFVESTPRSSARKGTGKRQLQTEETPITSKRRKRLAEAESKGSGREEITEAPDTPQDTREEEPDGEIFDTIAVAIPDRTRETSQSPVAEGVKPSRPHRSPKVIISKKSPPSTSRKPLLAEERRKEVSVATNEPLFDIPGIQQPNYVFATPTGSENDEDSPTPKATESTKRATERGKKSKQQDVPPAEDADLFGSGMPDEIPSSTWESEQATISNATLVPAPTSEPETTHKRFVSEEPADAPDPITMNKRGHIRYSVDESSQKDPLTEALDNDTQEYEGEDASDSDEAPEMVTTVTAASKAKAAEEDAARAYQAQQEKEERRRQQRAERIAQEQAEKRKREERKAKKLEKSLAKQDGGLPRQASPARVPLDVDVNNLPALLPESILEAVGDRRPPAPPLVRVGKSAEELRKEKLNRHVKFLERSEKPIKDLKKGSVHVSVLAQQNVLLAPKANKDTRHIREHWLKGRQQEKKGKKGKPKEQFRKMERKHVSGSFLRGGDD